MKELGYSKNCNVERLEEEILAQGFIKYPETNFNYYGISAERINGNYQTTIYVIDDFSLAQEETVTNIVTAHIPIIPSPEPEPKVDDSGKLYVRPETRPIDCTTQFTSRGDSAQVIGGGTKYQWDASESGDFSTEGAPVGFKKKVIDVTFLDPIYITAGACFFKNAKFGSYLDAQVMMPTQGGDVEVDHFVVEWPLLGDCSEGATIDSQTISAQLPAGLKVRITITVPVDDNDSCGYCVLKIYRQRTVAN